MPRLDEVLNADPIASDQPTSIRLDDLQSTESVNITPDFKDGIFEIPEETKGEWRAKGPIGFFEQWNRLDKTEMLPFTGTAESAYKSFSLLNSVNRIKQDKYSDPLLKEKDIEKVSNFLIKQEEERIRGLTTAAKIESGITQLPAFMVEFLATGGAAAIGKTASRKGLKLALQAGVERNIARMATRAAGSVGVAGLRTAAMPQRIAENLAERRLQAALELTKDKGVQIADEAKEKPITSFYKAIGDVMIENWSEETGEVLGKMGGALIPKPLARSMEKIWKRLHPNEALRKLWTKAGYNGFLAEMGEERLGDLARAVTGVDDFGADDPHSILDRIISSFPNSDELLVEAGVLAFPGLALTGVSQSLDLLRKVKKESKIKRPDTTREIDDAEADNLANQISDQNQDIQVSEEIKREMREEDDLRKNFKTREELEEKIIEVETKLAQVMKGINEAGGLRKAPESMLKEKQDLIDELKKLFRISQNFGEKRLTSNSEASKKMELTPDEKRFYELNQQLADRPETLSEKTQQFIKDLNKTLSDAVEPIASRMGRMDEKLKVRLRRFEFDVKNRIMEDDKAIKPFLEAYRNLPRNDRADLDLALKNRHQKVVDAIVDANGMRKAYDAVRKTLDELFERAKDVDLDIGYLENYFPRKIKNTEGFLTYFKQQDSWPELQEAIKNKEELLGRKLTPEEEAQLINTLLRGFMPGNQIRLGKPGHLKEREVKLITPELNRSYADSVDTLIDYVNKVNEFIEARKFFGKSAKGSEMTTDNIEASIGAFVDELLAQDVISGRQAKELAEVLKARFNYRGLGIGWANYRDLAYIDMMGSPISAVTQIGDIAFNLYKNGFYRVGKSLLNVLRGTALKKEDLGVERIAEEFSNGRKISEFLDKTFKLIGLDAMDRFGKETFIDATLQKFKEAAQNPTDEFMQQMEVTFGQESEQAIRDLRNGKTSENVKFLLFSELADVQPIALSEMPVKYLEGNKGGRIFYMLKTFLIKQVDVIRSESLDKIRTGEVKEGLSNLIRLSAFLMLMGATSDTLKDLLLGRPTDLSDLLIDNFIKLFGVSRYTLFKAKDEGPVAAFIDFLMPPFRFFRSLAIDTTKIWEQEFDPNEAELVQDIPFLGKFYYWWLGGGRAKLERKAEKEKRKSVGHYRKYIAKRSMK